MAAACVNVWKLKHNSSETEGRSAYSLGLRVFRA